MTEANQSGSNGGGGSNLDFSSLILGFSSAALYHLGYKMQGQGAEHQSFDLAQQNIEIIRMLREKTKGNLTPDEKRLLAEVLGDLDQKFDQAKSEAGPVRES